jgi:predicted RNase H-like nuclease
METFHIIEFGESGEAHHRVLEGSYGRSVALGILNKEALGEKKGSIEGKRGSLSDLLEVIRARVVSLETDLDTANQCDFNDMSRYIFLMSHKIEELKAKIDEAIELNKS